MFEKIEVNGAGACELYQLLTAQQKDEDGKADIGWNFTKFLVDRTGKVVARFGPKTTPEEIAAVLPKYL
jgi:glutathione peroxidase